MNDTEKRISELLASITDPDLQLSLGNMQSIKEYHFEQNTFTAVIELLPPMHTAAHDIAEQFDNLLRKQFPNVSGDLRFTEKELPITRSILPNVKNIIAVSSGKGGVGKSAICSNLAAALSMSGAKVGVLDADIYGPSQPTMFGLSGQPLNAKEENGKTIAYPNEKYGIKIASMGFIMNRNEAAIVRGPMLAGYFNLLVEQIIWGDLDFLLLDLPPGTGDIQLTMTQKIPLTGAVVITTPQEISLADVRRSIAMFKKVKVDILGIIENMSYFVPPDLPDKKYYIFGKDGGINVAKESQTDLLGQVPLDTEMRQSGDNGKPLAFFKETIQYRIFREISKKISSKIRLKNHDSLNNSNIEINI